MRFVELLGRRLFMAAGVLIGKYDSLPDLAAELSSKLRLERALRKAISIEQTQKTYWYEAFLASGRGHSNAQELMVREIETLCQILQKVWLENKEYRKQLGLEIIDRWEDVIRKYQDSSGDWLKMVEKYKATFLEAAHPPGVQVPPVNAPAPTQEQADAEHC